jgi:hypothetical protein
MAAPISSSARSIPSLRRAEGTTGSHASNSSREPLASLESRFIVSLRCSGFHPYIPRRWRFITRGWHLFANSIPLKVSGRDAAALRVILPSSEDLGV